MNPRLHEALQRAFSYGWQRWERHCRLDGYNLAMFASRAITNGARQSDLRQVLRCAGCWRSAQRRVIQQHYDKG